LRKNINYEGFLGWKNNPDQKMTIEIAGVISHYITNYYDFITTAPPSKYRDLDNYCCFKLCEAISVMVDIPFVISFQQRKEKSRHGRYASMEAEAPLLVPGWNQHGKSILFIDDFITSGMTAKNCYEILRGFNNHIDGLIYCEY
jgi:predicted amidophosphoribosyltransferase